MWITGIPLMKSRRSPRRSLRSCEPRAKGGCCNDLVAALAGGDLVTVVDFQTHFFAEVQLVRRVVAGDGHGLAIDEAVQLER